MSRHLQFIRSINVVIMTFAALISAGCGVSSTAGPITITPIAASLAPHSKVQLRALMTTPSGESKDVTTSALWISSNLAVATVGNKGLLTTSSEGQTAIQASVATFEATSIVNVVPSPPSDPVSTPPVSTPPVTSPVNALPVNTIATDPFPIPVYMGADLSNFPSFHVSDYGASGSAITLACSGKAGATQISCSGANDFIVGEGIRIVGAGNMPAEAPISAAPLVVRNRTDLIGPHTYCYVVDTVDPLGGITAPSPQACISSEPELSLATTSNYLTTTKGGSSNNLVGPSTTFLWYVSEDGGPFLLFHTASFTSGTVDLGQRIGSRGGWPDSLPLGNPNIAKNQDLFSVVQAVNGNQLTVADTLASSIEGALSDHDDTQAIESAILEAVPAGGGNIIFGQGTFNIRRPAFVSVINSSYAYPSYTWKLAGAPWWARYTYLYIPNGAAGNINMVGAGRSTTLVAPPDHAGVSSLLAVGNEQRVGAVGTPILAMRDTPKGATKVILMSNAEASTLKPGDDIFIYSGSFYQTPDVDTASYPDMQHFSELNTVASVSGDTVNLAYPTSKRYFDDGASSFGVTKLLVTPHNIEIQHMNIVFSEPLTSTGDVFGMLVNDIDVQGVMSKGAFGGGYKRGVTIENSQWSFGKGTIGWDQWDEYDQFTTLAFINNTVNGYAAPGSEGSSGMAKLLASEGTSQVLFLDNTFNHVSLAVGQTTECYIQHNSFVDGFVTAGVAYSPNKQYFSIPLSDRSFLSFGGQNSFSADHNTFEITAGFNPPWVIHAGDFSAGNISNNSISYSGGSPWFVIGSQNGSVVNNTIEVKSPAIGTIIELVPDESSITPITSFVVQGNSTTGAVIGANIMVKDAGFTDTAPVCIQANSMQVSKGLAVSIASSITNLSCP